MSIIVDTLADLVRDSITDADASREDWTRAVDQAFPREARDASRFWVHDSLAEDTPDVPLPFGEATVGIVDEDEGGVILYVHEGNAIRIIEALRSAANAY